LAEGTVGLTDLLGKVADAEIKGQLEIGLTQPVSVDGQIEVETVDFPAALAAAVGVPAQGSGAGVWPAEPFDAGLLGSVRGQIAVKSTRLALTPKLAARELRGILSFGPSEIAFESIDGTLAGGRLAGSLIFQRGADGMAARGQLRVAGAEVGELFPGDGRPPLSGRLTLDLDIGGSGRSPVALVGSLEGDGTFTLQDAGVARLDPAAFDQVTRAVDQGLPIDAIRIRDRVEAGLASGGLSVPMAEGSIVIANGQLRLPNTAVRARGADLAISTGLNLTEGTMDARLTLTGPAVASAPSSGRPDLMIGLKGPIDAPKRVLDVNALASWLALRAVEQQANRLDALESGRDPSVLPPSPGSAPVPRPAPTAPGTQTRPRPTTAVPGQPLAPVGLQKPKPVEELRPRPTAPVAEQVPAPPPPMDIRPAAPRARP
jgi:hypothetical protein